MPNMIDTIYGLQDESTLTRIDEVVDNENEYTTAVSYYNKAGELVHRTATVNIKHGHTTSIISGILG